MNAIPAAHLHCSEASAVSIFLARWQRGAYLDLMPWSDPRADTAVTEQSFRFGRADLVLYHLDGTATIVEAKDGRRGYNEVAKAIGQASLYATQLRQLGSVKAVRRAVLWTSAGDEADQTLVNCCREAGATPILMGDLTGQVRHIHRLMRLYDAFLEIDPTKAGGWLDALISKTTTVKEYGPTL